MEIRSLNRVICIDINYKLVVNYLKGLQSHTVFRDYQLRVRVR